jgi:hypothetical protein
MKLSKDERKWVLGKWEQIRLSQMAADDSNNKWKTLNAEINHKHARETARRMTRGFEPLTDLMKAEAKEASLPLKDALETGKWHSRNAERHIHDVQLFLKLKELEIL